MLFSSSSASLVAVQVISQGQTLSMYQAAFGYACQMPFNPRASHQPVAVMALCPISAASAWLPGSMLTWLETAQVVILIAPSAGCITGRQDGPAHYSY